MAKLRGFAGTCLVGYGLLVALRVVAHESLIAGLASLTLGAVLLGWTAWSTRASSSPLFSSCSSSSPQSRSTSSRSARASASSPAYLPCVPEPAPPPAPPAAADPAPGRERSLPQGPRGRWVAGLGAAAIAGLVSYNALVGSGLGTPEWGLLVYGAALVAAAPLMGSDRHGERVSTAVGWSFPLVLTPLILYAIHAILAGPAGLGTADLAAPLIHYALTLPTAGALALTGTASEVVVNNIVLATPRGTLSLGVGLVCAGIYPTVLFLGVLALHAWREGLAPRRLATYLTVGLAGLYLANLLRLVLLAKIGEAWGAATLQQAHAHLGWVLFVGFMVAFWGLVLRRLEPGSGRASRP